MEERISIAHQLVWGQILSRQSSKFPERECIVFEEKRFTYSQFNRRVNRLAHALTGRGIGKRDKVGILSANCSELMESYFAVCRIGAICVPLNFRLVCPEIEYILNNAECRLLIMGPEFGETIDTIRNNLPLMGTYVMIGGGNGGYWLDYEDFLSLGKDGEPLIYVDDNDPAYIMYTSGTTGSPKGAVITHKNQVVNCANMCVEFQWPTGKRFICVPPLFHAGALTVALVSMYTAGTVVILPQFDADAILKTIVKEKIDFILMVPAMWNWFINHPSLGQYDLSCLQTGLTGAAPMPIALKKKVMEKLPGMGFFDGFGQTEMTAMAILMKPEFSSQKPGSVGKEVINVEARVVDDEDRDVLAGEVGEIIYRGPTVMKEYYRNPEGTAKSFRGGWFHSGDLVRRDKDGFFFVVDRKNDMIISGGENIYPAEVEEVLYTHPNILEAAVIGIYDEEWGEAVMAVVAPISGKELTAQEVIEYCKGEMASYKKPKCVEFVEALPRNPTGKVLKTVLRGKYGKSIRY